MSKIKFVEGILGLEPGTEGEIVNMTIDYSGNIKLRGDIEVNIKPKKVEVEPFKVGDVVEFMEDYMSRTIVKGTKATVVRVFANRPELVEIQYPHTIPGVSRFIAVHKSILKKVEKDELKVGDFVKFNRDYTGFNQSNKVEPGCLGKVVEEKDYRGYQFWLVCTNGCSIHVTQDDVNVVDKFQPKSLDDVIECNKIDEKIKNLNNHKPSDTMNKTNETEVKMNKSFKNGDKIKCVKSCIFAISHIGYMGGTINIDDELMVYSYDKERDIMVATYPKRTSYVIIENASDKFIKVEVEPFKVGDKVEFLKYTTVFINPCRTEIKSGDVGIIIAIFRDNLVNVRVRGVTATVGLDAIRKIEDRKVNYFDIEMDDNNVEDFIRRFKKKINDKIKSDINESLNDNKIDDKPVMKYSFNIRNRVQFDEDKIRLDLSPKNPLALVTVKDSKARETYQVIVDEHFMDIAKTKGIRQPSNDVYSKYNFDKWVKWATTVKRTPFKVTEPAKITVVIPKINQEEA